MNLKASPIFDIFHCNFPGLSTSTCAAAKHQLAADVSLCNGVRCDLLQHLGFIFFPLLVYVHTFLHVCQMPFFALVTSLCLVVTFYVLIVLGNLGLLCSVGQQLLLLDLILHILWNIRNSPCYDRTQHKDHMLREKGNTPMVRPVYTVPQTL